jgi:hypothetical protein
VMVRQTSLLSPVTARTWERWLRISQFALRFKRPQFSEGFSARSTTNISTASFVDSNFNPS